MTIEEAVLRVAGQGLFIGWLCKRASELASTEEHLVAADMRRMEHQGLLEHYRERCPIDGMSDQYRLTSLGYERLRLLDQTLAPAQGDLKRERGEL